MKPQASINVRVIKSLNMDELNTRYAEAVFKIIKNKVPSYLIEEFIEKLKIETNFNDDVHRRDIHESSSNLQPKIKDN
jgi:hypothetical protein